MKIKFIAIEPDDRSFNLMINNITNNEWNVTIQKSKNGFTYGECDGNYIITRPDNGNLFLELCNYCGKHEEGTFNIEECKKEIRKELDGYFERLQKNYPEIDKWISDPSTYYLFLIHKGGPCPYEGYTNGLIDAWFSDPNNRSKNYLFSMVSLDDAFPEEYWDDGNFVFLPEQKVFPSVITEKMEDLGIKISIPFPEETGEEQIMKPSAHPNSFSFWTAIISIIFVGFLAVLSYVFPATIRFVPDEGEYVTETEVITMPVVLPGNINEKNDMKTKKRIAGLTRAKPEAPKAIIDTKDISQEEPYHYRRITRKAAPIQYFHLSMIFFVYVLCCVFCFIIFLKLYRRCSRQEQIDREFELHLAEKIIERLSQKDKNEIRKQFAKEAIQIFFSKDEA